MGYRTPEGQSWAAWHGLEFEDEDEDDKQSVSGTDSPNGSLDSASSRDD